MKKFLPSKKFLITLSILVVVGGAAVLFGKFVGNKSSYKQFQSSDGQVIVVRELVDKDTDHDGLKDWEEALWGTDANKVDTDGNGISDFEEVTKKKEILAKNKSTNGTSDTGNTTEIFSRQVVQLVSALSESGQLTDENKDAVTDQISNYIQNMPQSKTYSIVDIKVVPDSKENATKYVTSIANFLKTYPISPDDAQLLVDYNTNIDASNFTPYEKTHKKYQTLLDKMNTLEVPERFALGHIDFVNETQAMADIYDGLSKYDSDSIKALSAYSKIDDTIVAFQNATKNYKDLFK